VSLLSAYFTLTAVFFVLPILATARDDEAFELKLVLGLLSAIFWPVLLVLVLGFAVRTAFFQDRM
jgi:hypothetical protein